MPLRERPKYKSLTGGIDQITTDTTIWAESFTIQAGDTNTSTIFIQWCQDDGTAPASITTDTCNYELAPGASVFVSNSYNDSANGLKFKLSELYAKGTSGHKVRVSYKKLVTP